MDPSQCSAWTHRRFGLAASGLVASLMGLGQTKNVAAGRARCTPVGKACRRRSANCQADNCLQTPFTIVANWANQSLDHDTYLFIPTANGSTDPVPYISYACNPADSGCEQDVYPFTCVSGDATGPGPETTTVRKLLNGRDEYWVELYAPATPGDLSITLGNKGGAKVRSGRGRGTLDGNQGAWHVFAIDGKTGGITSVDRKLNATLADGNHNPNTDICPA